jgi:predicted nucleic acid-binding protein
MLRLDDGLVVKTVPRSFIFDILIAYSCRESGAVLVSSNVRDLERIRRAFQFEFAAAYPEPAA